MAKWIALCNGGPNNTTVGREYDSLGKACGALESMMKNLGATLGQVQQISDQKTLDQGKFVKTEQEAGKEEECKPKIELIDRLGTVMCPLCIEDKTDVKLIKLSSDYLHGTFALCKDCREKLSNVLRS